ncbi:MAG TPA: hypothetical protein PLS81_09780, partial [Deltaproteobacteria bacterium]|nr:hypothetical protein [Deltaproteobacteria bacterium]
MGIRGPEAGRLQPKPPLPGRAALSATVVVLALSACTIAMPVSSGNVSTPVDRGLAGAADTEAVVVPF